MWVWPSGVWLKGTWFLCLHLGRVFSVSSLRLEILEASWDCNKGNLSLACDLWIEFWPFTSTRRPSGSCTVLRALQLSEGVQHYNECVPMARAYHGIVTDHQCRGLALDDDTIPIWFFFSCQQICLFQYYFIITSSHDRVARNFIQHVDVMSSFHFLKFK